MNIPFFICITAAILCFIFIFKKQPGKKDTAHDGVSECSEESKETAEKFSDCDQFSTAFFERIQNGEKSQIFLSLSYQGDCSVIQSLLQSVDIPSFTEFEHFNLIKGGGLWSGGAGTNIRLSIPVNDYDTALEIVKDYIRIKTETLQRQNSKTAEAGKAAFALLLESPVSQSQRILGITVYPKNQK